MSRTADIAKRVADWIRDHNEEPTDANVERVTKVMISEEKRFTDEIGGQIQALIRAAQSMPPSREMALAITKLEEAMFWSHRNWVALDKANPYPEKKE